MGNSPALGSSEISYDNELATSSQPPDEMKITTQDLHRAGDDAHQS